MSLVCRFEESLGSKRGMRVDHAGGGGILWHDDARDNHALQVVFPAIQRAVIREIRKSPASPEIFDARKPRGKGVRDGNRLRQGSGNRKRHDASRQLIPEQFPARAGVSVESSSLANKFVAASRQFRDHAGAMA